MLLDKQPYTFDRVTRIALTLILFYGLFWTLKVLSPVLIPFAIAFLLAYLINPLVLIVTKKIHNKPAAVSITLFSLLIVFLILLAILLPPIIGEIEQMGKITSKVLNDSELAKRVTHFIPESLWQEIQTYFNKEDVQNLFKIDTLLKTGDSIFQKVLPGIWGVLTQAMSFFLGLLGLAIIGLYLVLLLLDYQKLKSSWQKIIPAPLVKPVGEFIYDFDKAMRRYFRAQTMIAAIVGILFAFGFWLIGLPLGILLGLFIGALNIVPYLQIIGLIPAILLAFIHAIEQGSNIWFTLSLTGLVFIIVQTIQDTLLVPKIMGKVTGLSPIIILLSLSIWGQLLGFLGLLIAIPITCLALTYYQRFLTKYQSK